MNERIKRIGWIASNGSALLFAASVSSIGPFAAFTISQNGLESLAIVGGLSALIAISDRLQTVMYT